MDNQDKSNSNAPEAKQLPVGKGFAKALLVIFCLLLICYPGYWIFKLFSNAGPGSEFMILALPVFAVFIICGLMGLMSLLRVEKGATPSKLKFGSVQIARGVIIGLTTVAVGFVTLVVYAIYQIFGPGF